MNPAPSYRGDGTAFADALLLWYQQEGSVVNSPEGQNLWSISLNAASTAAYRNGGPEAVSAALCHNIGRLLLNAQGPDAENASERSASRAGVEWLSDIFTVSVVEAVCHLPDARRWLLSYEKSYRAALDFNALRDLAEAGGPMTEAERVAFERRVHWRDAVNLARDITTHTQQKSASDTIRAALVDSLRGLDATATQKVA